MPDTIIEIKVQPKASKNEIIGFKGNILYLRITAPPVDNEANKAIFRLLSEQLNIPKSDFIIIRGERTRYKVIKIQGINHQIVKEKLTRQVK